MWVLLNCSAAELRNSQFCRLAVWPFAALALRRVAECVWICAAFNSSRVESSRARRAADGVCGWGACVCGESSATAARRCTPPGLGDWAPPLLRSAKLACKAPFGVAPLASSSSSSHSYLHPLSHPPSLVDTLAIPANHARHFSCSTTTLSFRLGSRSLDSWSYRLHSSGSSRSFHTSFASPNSATTCIHITSTPSRPLSQTCCLASSFRPRLNRTTPGSHTLHHPLSPFSHASTAGHPSFIAARPSSPALRKSPHIHRSLASAISPSFACLELQPTTIPLQHPTTHIPAPKPTTSSIQIAFSLCFRAITLLVILPLRCLIANRHPPPNASLHPSPIRTNARLTSHPHQPPSTGSHAANPHNASVHPPATLTPPTRPRLGAYIQCSSSRFNATPNNTTAQLAPLPRLVCLGFIAHSSSSAHARRRLCNTRRHPRILHPRLFPRHDGARCSTVRLASRHSLSRRRHVSQPAHL